MNTNLTVDNNLNVDNDLTVENNIGAIIPYQHPTAEVQSIMKKYVADTTVKRYRNELVKLMFWLFDKDPEKYFHDWILDNAIKADNEDKKSSKSMNQQKYLREVLKDSLNDVCKNHCPIILETVDFSTFSHFVTTQKSKGEKLLSKSTYGNMQSALMYLHKMAGFVATEDF